MNLENKVWDSVGSVWNSVWRSINYIVRDPVGKFVSNPVYTSVDNSVRDSIKFKLKDYEF